jgi:hypothetical protein
MRMQNGSALAIVIFTALSRVTDAQSGTPAAISGTVFDSLSRKPLTGAVVQLSGADSATAQLWYTAKSDSTGKFRLTDLRPGKYLAGFFHPTLDSLGVEMRGNLVEIRSGEQTIPMGGPTASTLMRTLCPDSLRASGLVVGHVRDQETDDAIVGALVLATWGRAIQVDRHFQLETESRSVRTGTNGWFVECGVPVDGSASILAARGSDTTGAIDLQFGADSVVRMDLFVASNTRGAAARLTGRIIDEHGVPLPGRVRLNGDTREVVASADGVFSMEGLPSGTRSLDFRAIGYEPMTVAVRLSNEKTVVRDVTLRRHVVLPTVTTLASQIAERLSLFEQHKRRSAGGFFLKPDSLAGYPAAVRDLRQYVGGLPGVTITKDGSILMRRPTTYMSSLTPYVSCVPRIFYNGKEFGTPGSDDEIIGVEVYTRENQIPSVYPLPINRPCGLIVIWTKPR